MKSKKAIAVLCALALVFTSSGGLPFGGLRLFDTAITASAVEKSVTFTATGTQDGITVSCRLYRMDSFFVNGSASKLTISSGSENITKLEITDSAVYSDPSRFTESHITVSAGNKSIQGGVLTVTDINAKSVTLSATNNQYWTTNKIVVYYGESAVDPTYTITIPAEVDLASTAPVNITAEDVTLGEGQKIIVTLDGASNTDSGSEFSAKTENGKSEVKYKINDGAIGLDDSNKTVAEFTGNGERELNFAVTDESGIKYAGTHTETLTFTITVEDAVPANPYASNNVGDVVTFGSYSWYIIGKSDNGVTLLMEKSFTNKAYNDSSTDVTWETCSLRTYLNGDFYNSFSDDDRAKIVKTSNTNPNNGSTPGGNETDDYIYLLSIEEANALSDTIRAAESWWWLRSPGYSSDTVAFVNGNGKIDLNEGYRVSDSHRVRPALNLKF